MNKTLSYFLKLRKLPIQSREDYFRHMDRIFELVTLAVALIVIISGSTVYRAHTDLLAAYTLSFMAVLTAFLFYRVLPHEGVLFKSIRFSFEDRAAVIAATYLTATSFLVFFSGGLESPYFFIYYVILVGAAVVLEPAQLIFGILFAILFILLIGLFHDQYVLSLILHQIIGITIISLFVLWLSDIIKSQRDTQKDSNIQLERLNQLKTDFISLMLHQVRNPLTALRWFLLDTFSQSSQFDEKQKEFFHNVYEQIMKLILLVNNLRDLAQIEIVHPGEEHQPLDLVKVTEDVIQGFTTLLIARRIKLHFEKPFEGSLFFKADPEGMFHIIQNLISNAIFYNRKDGDVIVKLLRRPHEIVFSVEDSGMGIREEEKPNIFTKFFRGEDAKSLDASSTGLGLYLAKAMIESYGGKVGFDSEYKKGSTFYFTLPLKEDAHA